MRGHVFLCSVHQCTMGKGTTSRPVPRSVVDSSVLLCQYLPLLTMPLPILPAIAAFFLLLLVVTFLVLPSVSLLLSLLFGVSLIHLLLRLEVFEI